MASKCFILIGVFFFISLQANLSYSQTQNILMFVSHEDTYYSEYIVMYQGLRAAGYNVDVRSASIDSASTYMIPAGTDISATAATLPGGSYVQFTQQFEQSFDSSWNANWNTTPAYIPVNGRIQDVTNMTSYDALVVVGGTGVQEYRYDGAYVSQGLGARMISDLTVQAAAIKLNNLAIEALISGKPVLGQCHGASLPVFWRVPFTSGPGIDSLGFSILRDNEATGFPEPLTATTWNALSVILRTEDRVTVSSPHSTLNHQGNATGKIITSRDWYPQTVVYAARTLLNILQTYPSKLQLQTTKSVLILHGGAVDSLNCSPANRNNDIPCNHGNGVNLPADFRHLQSALTIDSPNDSFSFNVTSINISASGLPYNPSNTASILSYIQTFHSVIFFKHWSTDVTIELQNALLQYADGGGGLISLHHGLYNDSINLAFNKNILCDQIFGVQSSSNTWSGVTLMNYDLFNTNYGHFITTYGMPSMPVSLFAPASWISQPLLDATNYSYSYYHRFSIYDELYNNMQWMPAQSYGRNLNQVTPLFSNGQSPASINHTSGFAKLFNPSADVTVGKLVYLQPGERRENYDSTSYYFQVIRNAVAWCSISYSNIPIPVQLQTASISCNPLVLKWTTASEIHNSHYEIETSKNGFNWEAYAIVRANNLQTVQQYQLTLNAGTDWKYIRLADVDWDGNKSYLKQFAYPCKTALQNPYQIRISPNPTKGEIHFTIDDFVAINNLTLINNMGQLMVIDPTKIKKVGQYHFVNLSDIDDGLYTIIATNDRAKYISRILVNK
ncbi:MAG: T9SS type A sorting domain-containing protein [Bacteroidia bacterium]|jgi:putative intracellular protease/amidase|nr:T9SS type A sorting domain-containing protein [Bacteroidia bacterium]